MNQPIRKIEREGPRDLQVLGTQNVAKMLNRVVKSALQNWHSAVNREGLGGVGRYHSRPVIVASFYVAVSLG